MLRRIRFQLSYANVVSSLALFVALGGVSYAAIELPRGSVGAKHLKRDSVTSAKVRNGSLQREDFRRSERLRLRGPQGVVGPQGPQGVPGPQGPAGAPGATNVVRRSVTAEEPIMPGTRGGVGVRCMAGEVATGGGAFIFGLDEEDKDAFLVYSQPTAGASLDDAVAAGGVPNGWRASMVNNDTEPHDFRVWVICASP